MNMDEVTKALKEAFSQPLLEGEHRKIIFWFDKDQEFTEYIHELNLEYVKLHTLNEGNSFYTKVLLEEEDPISNYLVYSNLDMSMEDNWLLDTILYSKTFFADKISLIMNELNIDASLRSTVKKYEKFFGNKERIKKFKGLEVKNFSEKTIELLMMSALCNLNIPDFEDVLKVILMDSFDDNENKYLDLISKYVGLDVFWNVADEEYGYEVTHKSLKTLFIHLAVTAFSHSVKEEHLGQLKNYIATRNKSNALVFIDHWMHHKTDYHIYDEYAETVEKEIRLADIVSQLPVEEFKEADTFPYIDRAIIIFVANSLQDRLEDYDTYTKLINLRRAKHYYDQYQFVYEALYYTVKMFEFHKKYSMGIPKVQAVDMYQAYVDDYYQMDMFYRKFYVAYDNDSESEILKKLKVMVENLYTNWYMSELSTHWSAAVQDEMKTSWALPGIQSQKDFYRSFVSPKISNGERVFVIISDALRYEIAAELADKLNSETTGACDILPLLGVLPSVTKMGMASLLPHIHLEIDLNGNVLVNGKSSSGIDNRMSILQSVVEDSTAIHYQELKDMNKAGRRETFKGKKLVYIYHDSIDATGDKAATEVNTFTAAERAIDELYAIVRIIRDDLSGTNIFITADHGFVYQREPLEESDKIEKEGIRAFEVKRRHLLTQEKGERSGLLDINMDRLITNEHQITTYVPKSTIRFKIQGAGANFVHGGASLQEIVVPLIQFKNIRSGQKNSREIEKVDVKLTNTTRKITNSLFTLNFFQTEKVEGKRVPRNVKIYMVDNQDNVISNEHLLICDRTSDKPDERTFKLSFALKSMNYDKQANYYLITQDNETNFIVEKTLFTINLGIISEFDF